jgi:hypothetical protein
VAGFRCSHCGQDHEGLPFSYGNPAPQAWWAIPEAERAARAALSSDQCVIDDRWFFLLGLLELPVHGEAEPFAWRVWVSVSETNFRRASELWESAGRESEPPYFGWLQSALPYPGGTTNLKCLLHTRAVGERPRVELEPTEHPLALEQRNGITLARVQQIAEQLLHGDQR